MKMKIRGIAVMLLLSVNSALAAQLTLGSDLQALTLNGEPVSAYQNPLALSTGIQVLTVRYDAFFERTVEDHEFIRSPVQVIRFEASPEQQYALTAPKLSLNQARDFAKIPSFRLIDRNNKTVPHHRWSQDELLAELIATP